MSSTWQWWKRRSPFNRKRQTQTQGGVAICGEWSVVKGRRREKRSVERRGQNTNYRREKTKVNDVTYKDVGIEKR